MNCGTKILLYLIVGVFISACGNNGKTYEQIEKMSAVEKNDCAELTFNLSNQSYVKVNIWDYLYDFHHLKKLTIKGNFNETVSFEVSSILHGEQHYAFEEVYADKIRGLGPDAFGGNLQGKDVRIVDMPNIVIVNRKCFQNCGELTKLNFPKLRKVERSGFCGLDKLQELKIGGKKPISVSTEVFGSVDTKNIVLYLGKYEYEHNVKGNVWETYSYPCELEGDSYPTIDEEIELTDWTQPKSSGSYTFKEIHLYE